MGNKHFLYLFELFVHRFFRNPAVYLIVSRYSKSWKSYWFFALSWHIIGPIYLPATQMYKWDHKGTESILTLIIFKSYALTYCASLIIKICLITILGKRHPQGWDLSRKSCYSIMYFKQGLPKHIRNDGSKNIDNKQISGPPYAPYTDLWQCHPSYNV